jgi:predicted acylesterase/phospholipase RssA
MILRPAGELAALPLLVAFAAAFGFAAPPASAQESGAKGVPRPAAVTHSKAKTPNQPAVEAKSSELPPRVPYTLQDSLAATVPGMPDVRFWADSEADYMAALPPQPGPWIVLSSGGADGAFGAGLLDGLSAAGKRPDYAVVTGVSTGALMAPFVFAGTRYDEAMRKAYTTVSAADIFEAGTSTGESFVNSWPLKDFITKQITPELMAAIAAAHRNGRRLFVVTTDLDAERSVVWNMGAIASHGGEDAAKLFCAVLLASTAIPGGFPPVLIDVEANGKHFQEMHVDGGLGGQFFVAPPSLMASTSDFRLPATQLYIVINTGLRRDFHVVDRFAPSILTQSIGMAVPVDTRLMADRTYVVAKRSGVEFNLATIPTSFNTPSRGAFDPEYMKALFQTGYELAQSGNAFSSTPPPYPNGPQARPPNHPEKTGANQ